MKLNPFSKSEPKTKVSVPVKEAEVLARPTAPLEKASASLLENIYVSEKASRIQSENNTYVFRASDTATKPELAKAIEKRYNVKVSKVRVISSPRKRRDTGRFPGYKSGFKKALITLVKGQTITQAQP